MTPSRKRSRKLAPIDPESYERGERHHLMLPLFEDAFGRPIEVPFILVRGAQPGPVLGLCAAVHGDELNGIRIIHELCDRIDRSQLKGTLLCAPIVNVPAYRAGQRRFPDGTDLNHSFPGKTKGRTAEQYARAFVKTFLPAADYVIDIHTASAGRVNSFYVRADMQEPTVRRMAELMKPDILLHVRGGDGTLRAAARRHDAPAITVEAGNPRTFQRSMVADGAEGIENVMRWLEMVDGVVDDDEQPVTCASSQWIYTTTGGILRTYFNLRDHVESGQLIAETVSPFGEVGKQYFAPHDGVVIGMAKNPVAVPGTRFIHLGRVGQPPNAGASS